VVSSGKGAAKTTFRRLIAAEDTQALEILATMTVVEPRRVASPIDCFYGSRLCYRISNGD
jgi:hypothetical protein